MSHQQGLQFFLKEPLSLRFTGRVITLHLPARKHARAIMESLRHEDPLLVQDRQPKPVLQELFTSAGMRLAHKVKQIEGKEFRCRARRVCHSMHND